MIKRNWNFILPIVLIIACLLYADSFNGGGSSGGGGGGGGAGGYPVVIQSVGSLATYTAISNQNVQLGDYIFVMASTGSAAPTSISCSAGTATCGTFTSLATGNISTSLYAQMWIVKVTGAGSLTIAINSNASSPAVMWTEFQAFSGFTNTVDQGSCNVTNQSVTQPVGVSLTTTKATEIVFGGIAYDHSASYGIPNAPLISAGFSTTTNDAMQLGIAQLSAIGTYFLGFSPMNSPNGSIPCAATVY